MNVGYTNSAQAVALRDQAAIYTSVILDATARLRADKRALARLHKELAELAIQERRDRLHAFLVRYHHHGVRVDNEALLADFHTLSGLKVASFETMRKDLLALVAAGRVWRKAISGSPKPGRVYVYGPVIAK